jgi:hypothetical protein
MATHPSKIQPQRPPSLKAIVAYKGLIVVVLLALSVISALSWRNYDSLAALAQESLFDGELGLGAWFLKTILHSQPQGLRLVARIAGVYALVMGTAIVVRQTVGQSFHAGDGGVAPAAGGAGADARFIWAAIGDFAAECGGGGVFAQASTG